MLIYFKYLKIYLIVNINQLPLSKVFFKGYKLERFPLSINTNKRYLFMITL